MAYAPARTRFANHLPIVMGIRGAYAIRPYTGTLKMNEDRIRSTPDGTVRGTYVIRPQTASGNLAFS